MSRFTYEYARFMYFDNSRNVKVRHKILFARCMFTFAEILVSTLSTSLCAMHCGAENRWFERIPLIKSVLQDKPDPLLMNSTQQSM